MPDVWDAPPLAGPDRRPAVRRGRRLCFGRRQVRRLTAAGVPAFLALGGAFPVFIAGSAATPASAMPSRVLCAGWARCQARGFDSYGYGGHQRTMYWRMFSGNNCTNYVAYVESRVYHVPTPRFLLGNGGEWAATARAHGVPVNHIPSVGAVAEWDASSFGMGGIGHVGVVEEVGPNGRYIVISQQHIGSDTDGYDWTLIKAGYPANQWQEWPSNFIHFRSRARAGIGYYNPASNSVSLRASQTAGPATRTIMLGPARLVPKWPITPLAGAWGPGGRPAVGFYTSRYGMFHLLGAGSGRHRNLRITFGPAGMRPLTGRWTRSGRDGIGYYDAATGTFHLRMSLRPGAASLVIRFGPAGAAARRLIPLAGDWTGGRTDGLGLYDPATGRFALRNSLTSGGPVRTFRFGPPHMVPLAGNWAGGALDGIGYYNPKTATFYLRTTPTPGRASVVIRFGPDRMVPLSGEWAGT